MSGEGILPSSVEGARFAAQARVVEDVAEHVGDQVHDIVKRHGMMLETAGMASVLGIKVAANLAGEVAVFAGLSANPGEAENMFAATFTEFLDMLEGYRDDALKLLREKLAERENSVAAGGTPAAGAREPSWPSPRAGSRPAADLPNAGGGDFLENGCDQHLLDPNVND